VTRAASAALVVRRRIEPVLELEHITFACDDPQRVCEFWSALLGYRNERGNGDWFARGEGLELRFDRLPRSPTIEAPIHLDVNVPDREAELERVLQLGGRLVETKSHAVGELSETWTVMRDPEGNGFCIQSPPNTVKRYIGNVTFSCAEPRVLGRFWADALGWPEEEIDESFLEQLREAGLDERELTAFFVTRPPGGGRPRFLFQRREKSRPESYPLHLDVITDDREAEIGRLTQLGATVKETKRAGDHTWTVMRDPEGNPFWIS
jgi:predicted enzyme related to lactoylglutathione lyase